MSGTASRALCGRLLMMLTLAFCSPVLSGCTPRDAGESADGGVLSSKADGQDEFVVTAPRKGARHWSVTFAFFPLCTTDGSSVQVTSVDWKTELAPREATAYIRQVPSAAHRNDRHATFEPFILRGVPSQRPGFGGDFQLPTAGGVEVGGSCDDIDPDGHRSDLAIALTTGPDGASVNRLTVHYVSRQEEHALVLDQSLILCGRKVKDESC